MITLADARALVQAYCRSAGAHLRTDEVVDRGAYWFFPAGFIGSIGVMVDKADGKLSAMGSALSFEDCCWGHEHGFSPERVVIRISAVTSFDDAVQAVVAAYFNGSLAPEAAPTRDEIAMRLQELPAEFDDVCAWLAIPVFRRAWEQGHFEFSISESCQPSGGPD